MYFTLTAYLNLDEPDLRVQQLHMTGGCCVEQCRSGAQSWEAGVGGASGFPEDGEPAGMGRDEHREDLQRERQARLCHFQAEFGI